MGPSIEISECQPSCSCESQCGAVCFDPGAELWKAVTPIDCVEGVGVVAKDNFVSQLIA